MYNHNSNQNSDHKPPPMAAPMSPRISFSNDFVESGGGGGGHYHPHFIKNERSYYRDAPVSSDFEFSVSNYPPATTTADELFSMGRLLPYNETTVRSAAAPPNRPTTLKDELLVEDSDLSSFKPPKSSTRWKGLLGLRKSHIGSKRVDKVEDAKREEAVVLHGGAKNSREAMHGGSSSCRDSDFRF
ncbi:unnamed protein product [Cuscuta epithymum]|uniref:Uncharacterized protein n=1 Tax=Cuscuta epithymum TaxID=186058 RepID=A0AAV0ELJ1_9ASTE|nr:unnamed protein product [Cuscuta epithymum]